MSIKLRVLVLGVTWVALGACQHTRSITDAKDVKDNLNNFPDAITCDDGAAAANQFVAPLGRGRCEASSDHDPTIN